MNLKDLSDQERLDLGLRFRLKHIRQALAEVEVGKTPDGFDFADGESKGDMLAELRRLEADVQTMITNNGADGSGRLN